MTALKFTEKLNIYKNIIYFSAITAGNKEQSINTEAAISCVVTGLSAALNVDNIIWKDDDETEITNDDGSEFFIDIGTYNEGTQTSTLTVPAAQTSTPTDKVFTCLITPSEEGASQLSETVNLKLYCKFFFDNSNISSLSA